MSESVYVRNISQRGAERPTAIRGCYTSTTLGSPQAGRRTAPASRRTGSGMSRSCSKLKVRSDATDTARLSAGPPEMTDRLLERGALACLFGSAFGLNVRCARAQVVFGDRLLSNPLLDVRGFL